MWGVYRGGGAMKNDVVDIETNETETTTDEIGDTITIQVYKEIFAEKKSVKQSEFYQAHSQGLKPEFVFIVHPSEYDGKNGLRYKGKQYKIIRTYEKDSENLELVVEGDVHGST